MKQEILKQITEAVEVWNTNPRVQILSDFKDFFYCYCNPDPSMSVDVKNDNNVVTLIQKHPNHPNIDKIKTIDVDTIKFFYDMNNKVSITHDEGARLIELLGDFGNIGSWIDDFDKYYTTPNNDKVVLKWFRHDIQLVIVNGELNVCNNCNKEEGLRISVNKILPSQQGCKIKEILLHEYMAL